MTYMNRSRAGQLFAACFIWVLACGFALAAKPDGAGHGQGKKQKHQEETMVPVPAPGYFAELQRAIVRDYYGSRY